MQKFFSRLISWGLVLSLVLGMSGIQMTTAFAAEMKIETQPKTSELYYLRYAPTGEYMDVGGSKSYNDFASGHSVILAPFSSSKNQQWELVAYNGYYQIVSVGEPEMMLSAFWASYTDGQPINARSRSAAITNAQRFDLVSMGDGSFRIDTTGIDFLTKDTCVGYDGTELVQRAITDSNAPCWFLEAAARGMFDQASSVYNQKIATWAMELAYAAYNPIPKKNEWLGNNILPGPFMEFDDSAEDVLAGDGFQARSYDYKSGEVVAHVIAHKDTLVNGELRPLVVVAVRGSVTWNDWVVNLATQLKWVPYDTFRDGAEKVLGNLAAYIKNPSSDPENPAPGLINPIVLVTGHSLGAAVANLLTHELNKGRIPGVKQANIYGYTFATPRVENTKNSALAAWDNLFNIMNRNDVVTYVPHSVLGIFSDWSLKDTWGRHGRSFYVNMPLHKLLASAPVGLFGHLMSVYNNWLHAQRASLSDTDLLNLEKDSKVKGLLPRILSIKCPVDITLYDNEGNVVAETVNNVVTTMDGGEVFAWVTEDGEKNYFLPYGSDVSHAEVIASDNGNMNFGIATLDADELQDLKTFEDITLEKGREYYVDLSEDIAVSDVRLMVTENGAVIGEVATDGTTTIPVKGIAIAGEHQRVLTVGQTTLLTATFTPTLPTNRTIIWTSSNPAVATVDINGVVTAHSSGGAIISGTSQDGGYKDQCIISVEPATEISILGDPTIILTPAQQHQLTADVTVNSVSRPITWSSSNEAIAVVSTNGTVTGVSIGNAIITATTKDGKTASVVVNVENKTAITIMGDATRILTLGQQHQLIANVTNNSTSLPVTWSSSNEAVAPVTASGIVTASSVGSAMITATTKDGYVAQVMITVEAKTGISIAGAATRVLTQGTQQQLSATVTTNSTSLPLTWTSSNEAVATVTANGLVSALLLGSTIITATTKDGYAAQVLVTVEAGTVISIAGSPTRALKTGGQEQLVANVTNNSAAFPITWASSNDAVATVSASGLVTALTAGSAVITATTKDGFSAQVLVTVEGNTTITIVGDATRILTLGQQYQLTADVTQNSSALPITWSSSNEAVAPITAGGTVTARAAGSAIITATTKDGFMAQVLVSVEAATEITIAGEPTRIATLDKTLQLTAIVTTNSTALPITWASSNVAVAAVSANGLVTAKALGSAMITATTKDGVSAQVMLTVEAPTTITIAGEATRILTLGLSEQLFANVPNNSTAQPITWTSSNPAVATVNEYGIVTAKAAGSAMISATTKDGLSAQIMVTVEVQTTITISGKPSGKLVVGKPHQLTANVPHSSTALPVTWTSSNEAVATVSASGLISPKASGNTIITATTKDGYSEQIIVTVVKEEFFLIRWLTTFFGWLITPFRWLWNAISYPFRTIGKL